MKFDIQLRAGDELTEQELELRPRGAEHATGGTVEFSLDHGRSPAPKGAAADHDGVADWAAIGPGLYSIILSGHSYEVRVARAEGDDSAGKFVVRLGGREYSMEVRDPRRRRRSSAVRADEGPQEIVAPMPSRIVKLLVEAGQKVEAGSGLVVIEAMKMQNELRAPRAGRIEKIYVREGEGVETGAKLVRLGL